MFLRAVFIITTFFAFGQLYRLALAFFPVIQYSTTTMLAIKLNRIGKKHQPTFRIVVAEKRSKMGGKYVEDLGFWNPRDKAHSVNKERAAYWISVGAQPTDTVHNIFVKDGVIKGKKKSSHDIKAHQEALDAPRKAAEAAAKAKAEAEAKASEEAKAAKAAEAEAAAAAQEAVEDAPVEAAEEAPTE
ncbi:MAG: 30S ribosomal protein S16 [Candidatus Wolfebacteria bacterium GW2011_GWE1_48_7]|uniref:Small ribosomal subunit protein bS16 n=2 Tax=Candidatus Wolfeibacteriota TaxID=1752735 RepID=A0A0G1U6B3_9BACT|nr:MAG: 30S ribosomal protein S16 [Candidatus Wolfebacteria bacterium GW2011_GWB1_47_1]KKU36316.1 MAG: 30S ribosomal protein S16 [Candidatus Wolfebacteria bacterium GW2011_GWC2_46_275]KKU41868.1 MAG: 30S ribosomal protein S16 [Candidatus Wolfebacteria bacterium GW2011_GWB2_46_69]KKU54145.1 MAG: 30S ribosomal protein S16 [Candidatus Wolfebacteria bacterium GW2011_GWC1_47_103]KKU59068.1 MAG: 30S ribosomal protein S16 [Candidatus Wolfebacteria bacterium GW2011_GWE2_47_12]KKU65642.1 MAG: 30S ribos